MPEPYKYFHAISKFALKHLLYVSGAGYVVDEPDFLIDRKYFDDYQCYYVIEGCFHLEQHGRRYIANKGETIIFDLREKHKYYCTRKDCGELIWMHFDGAGCKDILSQLDLPFIYTSKAAPSVIKSCIKLISEKKPRYELEISKNVYALLCDIVDKSNMPYHDADPLISKLDWYIEEHKNESVTLDMLSRYTSISKYHLCRLIKEKTGKTPIQYVLFRKIEMAKDMLIYSQAKISNIHEQLGFVDQSHFSKTFRNVAGVFPKVFIDTHY